MRRQIAIGLLISAVVGGGLYAATWTIAYTDYGFICENCGSRKGYREWAFGFQTNAWSRPSELERFMQSEYPSMFSHRWVSYQGDGRSLIPFVKSFGHGRPGPIIVLPLKHLDDYVISISAERKLDLYRSLSSGDEDVIQQAIDDIWTETIKKAKEPNQALQTTPMTRSGSEKTIEFGDPQRGV